MLKGGYVSIGPNDLPTGDGLAWALFQAIKKARQSEYNSLADFFQKTDKKGQELVNAGRWAQEKLDEQRELHKAQLRAILDGWAREANTYGPTIVAYFQEHARVPLTNVVATVSTSTSIGRTPTPNDPNTAIQGPSAAVELPITGASGAVELPVL